MIVIISAIIISKKKTITLVTNGNPVKITTYKSNVKQLLAAKKITLDPKDKISPAPTANLKNHQEIFLKKALNIYVYVDGKKLHIKSAENNISKMLSSEKIHLAKADKIFPSQGTPITEGLKIRITRIDTKTATKILKIRFDTVTKYSSSLPNTTRRIAHEGRAGEQRLTYKVTYHNGKVFSKKLVASKIVRKTIDKLIVQGSYPLKPVSKSGKMLAFSKKLNVRATAYWAIRGVGRTFTGSGRMAVRNPNGYSTVAVDRRLFPYGTKLFIVGYGFAVAADTGTSIIGNTIDVYFNTRREACNWAVKHPTVYVLK